VPLAGSQGRAGGGVGWKSVSLCSGLCCGELTVMRFSATARTFRNGNFDGCRALRSVTFVEGLEVIRERCSTVPGVFWPGVGSAAANVDSCRLTRFREV
jgi:hypothetical protein